MVGAQGVFGCQLGGEGGHGGAVGEEGGGLEGGGGSRSFGGGGGLSGEKGDAPAAGSLDLKGKDVSTTLAKERIMVYKGEKRAQKQNTPAPTAPPHLPSSQTRTTPTHLPHIQHHHRPRPRHGPLPHARHPPRERGLVPLHHAAAAEEAADARPAPEGREHQRHPPVLVHVRDRLAPGARRVEVGALRRREDRQRAGGEALGRDVDVRGRGVEGGGGDEASGGGAGGECGVLEGGGEGVERGGGEGGGGGKGGGV